MRKPKKIAPVNVITCVIGALISAEPALHRLAQQSLPMKAAYHIAKLAKLVTAETAIFHEKRQALFRQYGEQREATEQEKANGLQGQVSAIKPEHHATCAQALDDLAAVPVSLAWAPIQIAWLDALSISPADLMALEPLLTDTETPT